MGKFNKKNLFDIYFKMSLEEVIEYYELLREYELKVDEPIKNIKLRKKLYSLVKMFLWIDEISKKREVVILNDKRDEILKSFTYKRKEYQKDKSKVYSCTHIGRYDIESAIRAINEQCYFVMADPGESYQNLDGILLRLNGVSWFDMYNSTDRHATNVRQLKILNAKGNELVFPEQAYNLEPTQIVGDLHPGPFKRAIKTNSYVIPIGMEQYEENNKKRYVLNVGNTFDVDNIPLDEVYELSNFIKQEMISLKKEIWGKYGGSKPSESINELTETELKQYKERIDFIMRDVPSYYTIKQIVDEFYNPSDLMIKSLKEIHYL